VSSPENRPVSLAALTVLEVNPIDAVHIAASCGYSHVGLRPVAATLTESHFPILSDSKLKAGVRAALQDTGIKVFDLEIVRIKPVMEWDVIHAVLELAQELSVSRLLVADNDPDSERSAASLAELAERSRPFGVTPHLEFMPWTCTPNLSAARQRIAGISNCSLLIDAFHLVRSGGRVDDVIDQDPQIGYLQLCDIRGPIPDMSEILREARSDRLFPGDGEIDLVSLLRRLPGIAVSIEVPADRLRDAGVSAMDRARIAFDKTHALLASAGLPR
jgi:sugar phosphate isomerase/epimerase